MHALPRPSLHGLSPELKSAQPARPIHSIHLISSRNPPIVNPPGANHGDNLLAASTTASASLRIDNFQDFPVHTRYQDPTFVYPSSYSTLWLNWHVRDDNAAIHENCIDDTVESQSFVPSAGACNTFVERGKLLTNTHIQPLYNKNQAIPRVVVPSFYAESMNNITMATAPGSPPDLSESRSSKSSSYCSQFSDRDGLSTEITNFEDIGLDDDKIGTEDEVMDRRFHNTQTTGQRPQYTTRKPTLPTLQCQHKAAPNESVSRSAVTSTLKRGFTSPANIVSVNQPFRPRSSSPKRKSPPSSCNISSTQQESSFSPSPRQLFAAHSRRGSWQPSRKTIKELEAEYHDSDDELPDDASLWNVPISPFMSTSQSRRSSFRGSPVRESGMSSPLPIPLEHAKTNPELPPRKSSVTQPALRNRLTPHSSSNNPSRSNPSSPRVGLSRNQRTKSWNVALSELSHEARIVSENLEYHASQSQEDKYKDKWLPSIPNRSSAPSAIQLPPVQRGALDFMPISKEKEAILSRTRPSWLPPKDPKEEKKHLKEYQRMMAASIEAEKKKEDRVKNTQYQGEEIRNSLNRIWDYYVNPTTNITTIDRRVHDLCWRGISPKVRGKVWQRAVGNTLGLTSQTYTRALERAREIKSRNLEELSQHEKKMALWLNDIERDAETAFPELNLFQRNGPLWKDLVSICEAYACYRSDVGYVYGMQLVGALVLLQIPDTSEAFILLANFFNKPIPLAFQTNDIASTQRTYNRVISSLGIKFPRLHDYLFESLERGGLGLTGEEVLEPMFRTLFSNGLDVDRLCRVWDIWVFEGDRTLVRAAVAILGSLQNQIFDIAGDVHLKRRNVQEMLGWGPFNRTEGGSHWQLESSGSEEAFVEEIDNAGKLDYTGR